MGSFEASFATRQSGPFYNYIDHNREDATDEHGVIPLLTTQFGRISKSTIRETRYRWTHPRQLNGGHCLHGRDMDDCQAVREKTTHHPSQREHLILPLLIAND
ncbi:integrase-like protein [Haloferax mediterranei ATCC 33500]|uniref:Integrase-like protein n=1 Tax=Haloferax mediterranei (strain ATCC 33500 / DSM 1411 / JCM 8866 / NBRC 14739 / NCIMB 2177 / R-4) TaxID=523841 RepID=I3R716_HALMT|nr:integrase-like protein [Haloferax mediterranei ATCC 33500]